MYFITVWMNTLLWVFYHNSSKHLKRHTTWQPSFQVWDIFLWWYKACDTVRKAKQKNIPDLWAQGSSDLGAFLTRALCYLTIRFSLLTPLVFSTNWERKRLRGTSLQGTQINNMVRGCPRMHPSEVRGACRPCPHIQHTWQIKGSLVSYRVSCAFSSRPLVLSSLDPQVTPCVPESWMSLVCSHQADFSPPCLLLLIAVASTWSSVLGPGQLLRKTQTFKLYRGSIRHLKIPIRTPILRPFYKRHTTNQKNQGGCYL